MSESVPVAKKKGKIDIYIGGKSIKLESGQKPGPKVVYVTPQEMVPILSKSISVVLEPHEIPVGFTHRVGAASVITNGVEYGDPGTVYIVK